MASNIHILSRGTRRFTVNGVSSPTGSYSSNPVLTVGNIWANLVVTNGGVKPGSTSITAADTFWNGVVSCSIDSKIKALNFFAPDNITAAFTPLISNYGNTLWTNGATTPLSGANLSTTGLDGGRSRYLDTGINPSTCFGSNASGGLTVYIPTIQAVDAGYAGAGSDGGTGLSCYDINGAYYMKIWGSQTTWAISSFRGFLSANRTSTLATTLYRANSSNAISAVITNAGDTASSLPSTSLYAVSYNDGSGNPWGVGCDSKWSFYAVHDGLTSTEAANFYNLVQALRTSLGGGYV